MNLFNKITRLTPKDCFISEGNMVFIVKEGDIGQAIGKKGINVKKLSSIVKKPIKILEYSSDACKFVANIILPIKAKEVVQEGNKVTITTKNSYEKGQVFGRDRSNLKNMQNIVSKFFKEIEIIIN